MGVHTNEVLVVVLVSSCISTHIPSVWKKILFVKFVLHLWVGRRAVESRSVRVEGSGRKDADDTKGMLNKQCKPFASFAMAGNLDTQRRVSW
jgi:hypothetical protein